MSFVDWVDRVDWSTFVGTLISTFIGVSLAFGLNLWYDRRKKAQGEKEERIKALRAIKSELEENVEHIVAKDDDKDAIPLIRLSRVAFDSSVNSGSFALLDEETQAKLGQLYRDFDYLQMWTDKAMSMADVATGVSEEYFKTQYLYPVARRIQELRKNIAQVIELLRRKSLLQTGA